MSGEAQKVLCYIYAMKFRPLLYMSLIFEKLRGHFFTGCPKMTKHTFIVFGHLVKKKYALRFLKDGLTIKIFSKM